MPVVASVLLIVVLVVFICLITVLAVNGTHRKNPLAG